MQQIDPRLRGSAAIILASVLWGTTGTAASFAPHISPLGIGAFAMGVGGLLLALKSAPALRRELPLLLRQRALLVAGGLAVAVYPLAFYTAMRLAGVTVGTLVSIASAPVFTALLEGLINRRPITRRWLLSFASGVCGVILLVRARPHTTVDSDTGLYLSGIVLGLVAGLTYAAYSWLAKRLIDKGLGSEPVVAGMFLLAAAVLLPSLALTGTGLFAGPVNTTVALYMAVVPMFLGYLAFGYGLRFVPAAKVTLITLLEPVVAAALAMLVLGERLTLYGCLGVSLVFACLVLQLRVP
ncbi:EamA family transporter [Granulosicoccaceae sp. 1_MG-2023]|nr:EamA family transporter [Granulosicoccaceae sp. 1_MG-2023]